MCSNSVTVATVFLFGFNTFFAIGWLGMTWSVIFEVQEALAQRTADPALFLGCTPLRLPTCVSAFKLTRFLLARECLSRFKDASKY